MNPSYENFLRTPLDSGKLFANVDLHVLLLVFTCCIMVQSGAL